MIALEIYKINIVSELCFGTMLAFLLLSLFVSRKKLSTSKPLLFLIITNLLLLLCQIAEWFLMIKSGNQTGNVPSYFVPKIITYTLDYGLGYFSSLAYFVYVEAHIKNICKLSNKEYKDFKYNWVKIFAILGLIFTLIFGILMNQNWFYYLRVDGSEMFNPGIYLVMILLSNTTTILTAILLIKYYKELGLINFLLLLFCYEMTNVK